MVCIILPFLLVAYVDRLSGTIINSPKQEYIWKSLHDADPERIRHTFMPSYIEFESNLRHLTIECKTSIRRTIVALEHQQNWAVSLFNSWGKFPPSGLTQGTLADFGDYDQCLSVDDVQYCLVEMLPPLPPMPSVHNYHHKTKNLIDTNTILPQLNQSSFIRLMANESAIFYWATIQLGICLPNTCTTNDVHFMSERISERLALQVKSFMCESKRDTFSWNKTQLFAMIFMATILGLTLMALIYDQSTKDHHHQTTTTSSSSPLSFLLWFSPGRNIRKVLDPNSNEVDLSCVHGLRVFSIVWVVVGHTLEWNQLNAFRETFSLKHMLASLPLQLLFKAPLAVETFFYLSGLLTSYITLNFANRTYHKFSCISFLTLRYARLTPQLAVFMLLTALLPTMYDGPIWNSYMDKIVNNCAANWWVNLAYMQNFIDFEHICSIHTWFLANDMQLHWLSLIPMLVLFRNRFRGLLLTVMMIVVTIALCSAKIYIENFPPETVVTTKTDFRDGNENPSLFYYFYFKPWIHIVPFFGGFIFGEYLYQKNRNQCKEFILNRMQKYISWLTVLCLYLFEIYCTVPYLHGRPYDPLVSSIIFPLSRVIWSSMLSMIVWLCLTGNGGIVGRFLSWSALKPLSRLTYAVYLTHAWTLWITLGARRDLIEPSGKSIITLFGGVLLSSYTIAFIFTVLIESPLLNAMNAAKMAIQNKHEIQCKEKDDNTIVADCNVGMVKHCTSV
ncbi:hypothetical protein BLOT_005737 [Blomia tropicalis]|nr:hypothetical protein BLOT_005737 [Blomia tropicalis]